MIDHAGWVSSVTFSPDGRTLAFADDTSVRLWDVSTWKPVRVLDASFARSVVFSPNGRILAFGSGYKTIKLCDVATGKIICILNGHASHVMSVAFSPDGCCLASGSDDGTVLIWNMEAILHK